MANGKKKGQIQLTFNWIYIAIAGAVILLFFFSIIVKQKQVSEERLSGEVVRIMESILAGAGVSEKTKNFIDASGLAEYTLYFDCDLGVGEFGIVDSSARAQNSIDPVFAPRNLKSHRIIAWSLPYKLPFKVIDFLMITSLSNKYYLVGSDNEFVNEFIDSTEGFNREYVEDITQINPDENLDVRIIDLEGDKIAGKVVPENLQALTDSKLSAVVFTGENQIDYYQKNGITWEKLNENPVQIISLPGERDAAKYAAIFSGDDKIYQCNTKKAFRRLEILTEIYGGSGVVLGEIGGKIKELDGYYTSLGSFGLECLGHVKNNPKGNLLGLLQDLNQKSVDCQLEESLCPNLISTAADIKEININLRQNCIQLY